MDTIPTLELLAHFMKSPKFTAYFYYIDKQIVKREVLVGHMIFAPQ